MSEPNHAEELTLVIRTPSMRLEPGHRYLLNPGSVDQPHGGKPLHTSLGRPDTDRDQSVILVTLCPG